MLDLIAGIFSILCITAFFIISNILDYKDCSNDNVYKRFKIRETRRLIRRLEKDGTSADVIAKVISSIDW